MRFAAIDFETANNSRDSACAVGLVVVDGGEVVDRIYHLIQPPTDEFRFTSIHGLTWDDVCRQPTFDIIWRKVERRVGRLAFMAAHNAPFDHSVLSACCHRYQVRESQWPFMCTVQLARQIWGLYPTKLPNVCDHLGICLNHHHADSDAEACARIVLAAVETGWEPAG